MSYLQFTIRDAQRSIRGQLHGSRTDLIVASLASDPETIEELEAALVRFQPNDDERDDFRSFHSGTEYEPYDAGVCVIDLAARVVACESTYSHPGKVGQVCMLRAREGEDVEVMYHLADDWNFVTSIEEYNGCERGRRAARAAAEPLDARPVIYGRVCRFIVEESIPAVASMLAAGGERNEDAEHDAIRQIHARWLTTPRDDLRGRAPRDVLLDGHHHLVWELQDRAFYWSMLRSSAPPISQDSHAYRYGGFGTHEIVIYYELVRSLICHAWNRQMELQQANRPTLLSGDALTDEISHLEGFKEDWLASPDFSDLHGRIPAQLIHNERIRLPEVYSGGHVHEEGCCDDEHDECDHEHGECDHEHDDKHECDHEHGEDGCSICDYLNTPDFGPMFWCLDGCNIDEEFAFSFCRTREEYDEKQHKQEEDYRHSAERHRLLEQSKALWMTEIDNYYMIDFEAEAALEALSEHVNELIDDLDHAGAAEDLIEDLGESMASLQAVAELNDTVSPDPAVEHLSSVLNLAASEFPQLADKCRDLVRRTGTFVELNKNRLNDEDMPF